MIPYNWNPQQQQQPGGQGQGGQQQNPIPNNPAWQQQQAFQYAQQQQQQQAYYQQFYQQQQQQQTPNQFTQATQQQGNPFVNAAAQQSQFPMASNYQPPLPPGPPPSNNNMPQYNQQLYGSQQQRQQPPLPPPPPSDNVNMVRPPLPPSQPQSLVQQQQNQGQNFNSNTNQQQQQLPNMNQISNILSSMKNLESIPGLDKGLEFLKTLNTNLGGVQNLLNQNKQNIQGGHGHGGPTNSNSNVAGGGIKPLMSLQVAKPNLGQQQQQLPNKPLFPSAQNQPSNKPTVSSSNNIQPNPNSFLTTGSLLPNPLNSTFDKLLDKIDNNLLKTESNDKPADPNQVLKGWKDGEGQRPVGNNAPQNSNNLNKNTQNRSQNQHQQDIRPQQNLPEEVFDKQTLETFDKKFRLWEIDFEKWKAHNQNHPDRKNYLTYLGDWNKLRHQLVNQRHVIVQKIQIAERNPNFQAKTNNKSNSNKISMPDETLKSENSSKIKIEKSSEDNVPPKELKVEEEAKPKSTETENVIKLKEEPSPLVKVKPPPPPRLAQNKGDEALLEKNVTENKEISAEDNSTVKEELEDEIKRLMPKIRIPKMDDGNKSPPILRKGFDQDEDDRNEFNQPPQPQRNQQQPGMQGQQGVFNNPQNINPFTQALHEQQQFNNQMNMPMSMNQNNPRPRFNQPQFPVNNNMRQPYNPFIHNNSNPNFREQQKPLDSNVQEENGNNYQGNNPEGEAIPEAIPQFSRPHRPQQPIAIAKTEEESTEVFEYGHAGEAEENDYDDIIHDRFQNEPDNEAEVEGDDDAPVVVDYGHGAGDAATEETPSLEPYRKPRLPLPPHLAGYYGHHRMPMPHPHFPPRVRGPYPYPPEEYYGYEYDYEYDYEDPMYLPPPPPHMMGFPRPRFPPPMGYRPHHYPPHYPHGPGKLPFNKSRQPMAEALALARGGNMLFQPEMMPSIDPDEVDNVSPGPFSDEIENYEHKEIRIAPPINEIRIAPPPPSRSERERERERERDRDRESRDKDRRKRSRSRSPKRRSRRDDSPIHLHSRKEKDRSRERDRGREHSHSSKDSKDRDRDRGRDKERDRSKSERDVRKKSRSKSPASSSDRLKIGRNPAPPPPAPISTTIPTTRSSLQTTQILDLINLPGRKKRPSQFVIFLRGLPGSGKTHAAKIIKDKEVEHGGNAPRMLSIDDYFMVESEKSVKDPKSGKEYREKIMIYEYDSDAEPSYRTDLIRALKKTIETGYFNFIIVDSVNNTMKDIEEMSNYAALKRFQVYIAELDGTVNECYERNIHNRSLEDIQKLHDKWEQIPDYYIKLNIKGLFEDDINSDVEMEDVSDIEKGDKNDLDNLSPEVIDLEEDEDEDKIGYTPSKWETIQHSEEKLNKLDGFKRKRKSANDDDSTPQSMEEWLELQRSDIYVRAPISGGKKRVRWADIVERKEQERMRDIGFVVGQTDWNRMNDPSFGASSLTKTKFI